MGLASSSQTHICLLGLDGVGKTTILYQLKCRRYVESSPTIGFNCETIKIRSGRHKGVTFLTWDVGGSHGVRHLWQCYVRSSSGIVFVVDSLDPGSLEESRIELEKALQAAAANFSSKTGKTSSTSLSNSAAANNNSSSPKKAIQKPPVLILANKQDRTGAVDQNYITKMMKLKELASNGHAYHIQECCAVTGDGVEEGLTVLYDNILRQRKALKSSKR